MAKTVTLTISVSVSGDGYGGQGPLFSQSYVNATGLAPGSVTTANGFVAVTVPVGALGVLVVPPVTSTLVKTYKGITGDTGVLTDPVGPAVFKWTAAQVPPSFGITTTGIEICELIWL